MLRKLIAMSLAFVFIFACLPVVAEETETEYTSEESAKIADISSILGDAKVDVSDLDYNEDLPSNILQILFIGLDNNTKKLKSGNNFATVLCSINLETGAVKLTSFSRNLGVDVPGYQSMRALNKVFQLGSKSGSLDKGARLMMRTINQNFHLNIKYYMTVNIFGLAEIFDAVGGFEMELTKAEAVAINKEIKTTKALRADGKTHTPLDETSGVQYLDGMQAAVYCKIGKNGGEYELTRSEHQLYTLASAIAKAVKEMSFSSMLTAVIDTLPYISTNLTSEVIAKVGGIILSGETFLAIQTGNLKEALHVFEIPMDGEYTFKSIGGTRCASLSDSNMKETLFNLFDFIYDGQYDYHE